MRDYVLMTDSCCDLTDYMARELELEVLPLTMHMDGQDYPNDLAGTAISNEEFYKRIPVRFPLLVVTFLTANTLASKEVTRRCCKAFTLLYLPSF